MSDESWAPVRFEGRCVPASGEDSRSRGTVGLVSLGCPKALVDSEVMLGRLGKQGWRVTHRPDEADVLVVNTCAFIDQARQESIDTILEMAREKQNGRAKRLVVTGCLVQRHDEELRREIPEIDATLGTGQGDEILAAVEGRPTRGRADLSQAWTADHTAPRVLSTAAHMAYVKISEGCDYTCSFCIIPSLRGRHRSRPVEDVVAEVEALADGGVKEVVLVAQDSTRYGLDLGLREGLAILLRRLGGIRRLRWIRVLYAYPATLSDGILEAIAGEEKVVKYIDVPWQHAADSVLRRMQRPLGRRHLMGLLERMRRFIPGLAVRSSFIVGFPGESECEFEELVGFVREAQLDHVGVFTYSHEDGTPAFDLANQVPPLVRHNRRRRLMALQRRISLAHNRRKLGRHVEVLVEGPHPESEWLLWGRLASQAPEIDGSVLINDGRAKPGDLVWCEVSEAHAYDVVARIVPGVPSAPSLAP